MPAVEECDMDQHEARLRLGSEPQHVATRRIPTVLIAEYRDEVFARLASDLTEMGVAVFRAERAQDILWMRNHSSADLALCYLQLTDESGWLATAKMRTRSAKSRVWLYSAWESPRDWDWGKLCGVERIIYYRGDLFVLSDAIKANMGDIRKESRHSSRLDSQNVIPQVSSRDHLRPMPR